MAPTMMALPKQPRRQSHRFNRANDDGATDAVLFKTSSQQAITRPDTRAKTVRLALFIFRTIPSCMRPIPSSMRPIPSSLRPIPSTMRPITGSTRPIPETYP